MTDDEITALLATSGTEDNLRAGVCTDGAPIDWWCWRFATLLGQVGNEQYFRCGQCEGFFRTGTD